MEPKRLYRSRRNSMIAGVCGGLAEYLNMDPHRGAPDLCPPVALYGGFSGPARLYHRRNYNAPGRAMKEQRSIKPQKGKIKSGTAP